MHSFLLGRFLPSLVTRGKNYNEVSNLLLLPPASALPGTQGRLTVYWVHWETVDHTTVGNRYTHSIHHTG